MPINVIFLDIDGVLNNFNRECQNRGRNINLSKPSIQLLNQLIEKSSSENCPTKIVLSSVWRKDFNNAFGINAFFEAIGIKAVVIDKTPVFGDCERGSEILAWLIKAQYANKYNIKSICIIDDDADMGVLMPWLVRTDTKIGLDLEKFNQAKDMLNRPFELFLQLGC